MGAAAVGAAYVILRNPPLRRLVLGLATTALSTQLPRWLRGEVVDAWNKSARVNPRL